MAEALTPERLAYVAGVVDARAHIEVTNRHGRPQPRLSVTTRRRPLLDHLAALTGTNVSVDDRGYERRGCGEHCAEPHVHVVRQSAKWRVDCGRATVVLYNVLPLLVSQVDDARRALLAGLDAWPPARGNTGAQMAALGWPIPDAPADMRDPVAGRE